MNVELVKIEENKPVEWFNRGNTYMFDENGDITIVICTKSGATLEGTCIYTTEEDVLIGDHDDKWDSNNFIKHTETITLKFTND